MQCLHLVVRTSSIVKPSCAAAASSSQSELATNTRQRTEHAARRFANVHSLRKAVRPSGELREDDVVRLCTLDCRMNVS